MKYLQEIQKYSNENDTDISSHLDSIYIYSLKMSPKCIVELGVRDGQSSRIFNYINKEIGSTVFGVDITDCDYSYVTNGKFICRDDCEYSKDYLLEYGSNIDILFIDTSHLYEHTVKEIKCWFPLLNEKALVIFHDTNLDTTYIRKNWTKGNGWNNNRGVIRAIEEYFNTHFNEKSNFEYNTKVNNDNWFIIHEPLCNGLTCCFKNTRL